MPRVAGVDPGTVSFDLCVLQDSEPVVEQVFETQGLAGDYRPLLRSLRWGGNATDADDYESWLGPVIRATV